MEIIREIKRTQLYNTNKILNLDGNYNTKILNEITDYIVRNMKACGQVVIIGKIR